ncbi:MAG: hypothetical protein BRC53_03565 [Cyanobacteria bacterium SW_6_48_11]|nr:MAG: hypothetical protein BRC53_03565 [Cyanobacteria bacterium SW_6_48_11]PSP03908.1 MAG: hypothetical protein BRC51_08960 [Cyanobacteria bacterium SW_12_48_29]PSP11125.1 MAG: hypothetical protein BRC50_12620 [Cyanobacteria bacterium SW_11_48_12]PSP16486.1 MAG: hypothetical protein BRC52_14700 [Cyanobacteria bacterium SW_5_48_44]
MPREYDILRLLWSDNFIEESDEVEPGVILDYDSDGNVVGIEVLNASSQIKNLSLEYTTETTA